MAITSVSAVQLGPTTWEVTAASDLGGTPTFYWYVHGVLRQQGPEATFLVEVDPDESMDVEVFDSALDTPGEGFPARGLIFHPPVAGATQYRIDKWNGSSWDAQQTYAATGDWQRWSTPVLADGVEHRFRVVPIAAGGIEGTPFEMPFLMVRRPAPGAAAAVSVDAGTGVVTVG